MADLDIWQPLRRRAFFSLWTAAVVSNVGTWMHDTAAAWTMATLAPSPLMVSLMQTATTFPFFVLALPAGALADVVDRRRMLILTQAWMLAAATALGVLALAGTITPPLLLVLTFAIGIGAAMNAPAWQATTPDLVPRAELPAAVALGGISVNVARAVGPPVGGLLVGAAGAGPGFLLEPPPVLCGLALVHGLQAAIALTFVGGMAWMTMMSSLTVAAQESVPAWVRARALAVGLLVIQGSMAAGALGWGVVATHTGLDTALLAAAVALAASLVVAPRFRLDAHDGLDLRPSDHMGQPVVQGDVDLDQGPVLVTVEYRVDPARADAFVEAME